METISIRELHARTGHWVRRASELGEIQVTDNGEMIASIVPVVRARKEPFFSKMRYSARFRKLDASGKLGGGTDATQIISEDREDRTL
jgi:antitoxin (DNA-binding transcriptional repressor) of toxin-antitoxin stability system